MDDMITGSYPFGSLDLAGSTSEITLLPWNGFTSEGFPLLPLLTSKLYLHEHGFGNLRILLYIRGTKHAGLLDRSNSGKNDRGKNVRSVL